MSGGLQESVLGPLLFNADIWNNLKIKLHTLYSKIINPTDRVNGADSLNRDLLTIQTWCSTWGMNFNPNKTYSIIVFMSRTALPEHPPYIELNWKLALL